MQTLTHLGPLTQLTVGQNQAGPTWLLDRVQVTDEGTGLLYIFFCGDLVDGSSTKTLQVRSFDEQCLLYIFFYGYLVDASSTLQIWCFNGQCCMLLHCVMTQGTRSVYAMVRRFNHAMRHGLSVRHVVIWHCCRSLSSQQRNFDKSCVLHLQLDGGQVGWETSSKLLMLHVV